MQGFHLGCVVVVHGKLTGSWALKVQESFAIQGSRIHLAVVGQNAGRCMYACLATLAFSELLHAVMCVPTPRRGFQNQCSVALCNASKGPKFKRAAYIQPYI